MPSRIVVVPPTHAQIADIARETAPSGFELVVSSSNPAELHPALATAEYMVCYPNVISNDAFYKAAPKLKLFQLLIARLRISSGSRCTRRSWAASNAAASGCSPAATRYSARGSRR